MNIDKASRIRQGEELDIEQLSQAFDEKLKESGKIVEVAQFPGGFSNLTYLIKTENQEFVLRRPPFGASAKGGHDMGREFKVLTTLRNAGYTTVPTPIYEGRLMDNNDSKATPYYVMERLKGVILRAKDTSNPALLPNTMKHLCEKLIDNLAALHNLDIEKTGLAQLGKPEGYVIRQVDGWISRYKNAQTDDVKDMDILADWITTHLPKEQKPAFLHNDYKFDNVVWDIQLTNIIGVLDWEMSTVGDPLMDFGSALAYWCEISDSDFTKMFNITWLKGCLNRSEVISRYAQLTGRDVSDILFYYVFGLYKNAVIIQQIYARWKKGLTQDARFSGLIAGVYELSKMAKKAIDTGKV